MADSNNNRYFCHATCVTQRDQSQRQRVVSQARCSPLSCLLPDLCCCLAACTRLPQACQRSSPLICLFFVCADTSFAVSSARRYERGGRQGAAARAVRKPRVHGPGQRVRAVDLPPGGLCCGAPRGHSNVCMQEAPLLALVRKAAPAWCAWPCRQARCCGRRGRASGRAARPAAEAAHPRLHRRDLGRSVRRLAPQSARPLALS